MTDSPFISRWGLEAEEDRRWIQIPGFIVKNWSQFLTIQEWAFIIQIMSFKFDCERGQARPSLETIRQELGYASIRSVQNIKNSLIEKGLLKLTERSGKPHIYDFAPFTRKCEALEAPPAQNCTPASEYIPNPRNQMHPPPASECTQRIRRQDREVQEQKTNTFSPDGELDLGSRLLLFCLLSNTEDSTQTDKNETTQEQQTAVQESDSRQAAQKRKKSSAKKKKKVSATQDAAIQADDSATGHVATASEPDTPDTAAPVPEPESADDTADGLSPRELNDRYQEITSRAFGLNPGALTGKLVKFFRGRANVSKTGSETEYTIHQPETAWTPAEIGGLWIWYWNHPRYGGRSGLNEKARYLPRTVSILRDRMDEFRASPEFDKRVTKARQRLDRLMGGDESASELQDEYQSNLPEGYYDNHAPVTYADPPSDPWAGVDPEERKRQQQIIEEVLGV